MIEKSFINYQLGIKFNSYIDHKCRVWFKAKEVASILGYRDTNQAIRKHVSENHKRKVILRQPVVSTGCSITYFIDEPGFYELVFKSRLQSAKIFRQWVFDKVLPSIRKYGYYKMIDYRKKQRVIIDGKKFYKHLVFSNYAANKNGDVINVKTERILKMVKNSGYYYFNICDKRIEKSITYYQHRFVYEVFKGVIPRCLEIDHINEIKKDNRIKNLQLLTHKQNIEKSKNRSIISTYFIDEPGFYELVFKSRLQSAKIFRQWVFDKVLPSIRKYGYYKMIDYRKKQRVIIDGKKFYKHLVFSNYAANKNGDVINVKTERILKMVKNSGYYYFNICDKRIEKSITYYQHRFVYEVFKGVIPRCLEIDHINEIKKDNRIKNLQLLTHKQNIEKSKNRSIISTNIENGKERRFISIKTAAIELDINAGNISKICRKKGKTATSKKNGKKYTFKFLD